MTESTLPFMPRDWVANDSGEVAQVKDVYRMQGEVLLDLVIFSRKGDRVGRKSAPCGGPRTFEPACSSEGWFRVSEPTFPLRMIWADRDGARVAAWDTGTRLPPAEWVRRPRRRKLPSLPKSDPLVEALRQIAGGHNDARALARETLLRLGRKPGIGGEVRIKDI